MHKYVIIITMAKPRNPVNTEKITIFTTPHVRAYLEALVSGGLYGKNAPEAAERLISRSIELLIRDGTLKLRDSTQKSES